jgi:hypothetical protein
MINKKAKKERTQSIPVSIPLEMAKPRMTRSARIAELNLDTTRISKPPSIIVTGTVDKIIPASSPRQHEKALITVDGADPRHRDLRIENALIDEHGDDVRLEKGVHVDVTAHSRAKRPVNKKNLDLGCLEGS